MLGLILGAIVLWVYVTEQDPVRPSWDGPLPYILCFGPSLKDLDNSI